MANYIEQINKKYQHTAGIDKLTKEKIFDPLEQHITSWAYRNHYSLTDVKLSGSRAKGTAISSGSDMDIFIYLSSSNTETLKNIYNSLFDFFSSKATVCVKQDVSIGVRFGGMNVDLIPGQRQSDYHGDHSLYKSKEDTWIQTNIDKHINIVKNSNLIPEIVAAKIWRHCHRLLFPSIFLELVTIEALKQKTTTEHDKNFMSLLGYLKDNIQTVRIIDPANPNNIISDDIVTTGEKRKIANAAKESRIKKYWKEILW
ncbi:MAG: nucleotidyltransferase domain-containing protein [Holophagales bacterium]|jgi:hypothetical protein|nr:nucleotidyltransferase domain-containing protein [Holophagales bacterium]